MVDRSAVAKKAWQTRKKRAFWIQNAVKRKGSLRRYVLRKYGGSGFVKRNGRLVIKKSVLEELAGKSDVVGARARLALTLRRFK